MSTDNKDQFNAIEVADVPLTQAQSIASTQAANFLKPRAPRKQIWLYGISTIFLLVTALVVITIQSSNKGDALKQDTPLISDNSESIASSQKLQALPTIDTPFEQQRLAAARRAAQDVLARIIEQQEFLEIKQVKKWAQDDFNAALLEVQQGDELFRLQQYAAAQQKYLTSEAQLGDIVKKMGELITSSITAGLAAINAGQSEIAETAFSQVLTINPANTTAQAGLQRAKKLPLVLALINKADKQLDSGTLTAALIFFEQALAIDSEFEPAILGVKDTNRKVRQRKFKVAMDAGYANIQQAHYLAAMKSFRLAVDINSDSTAAKEALALAKNEHNQRNIHQLLSTAQGFEESEQWRQARTIYQQVLSNDSTVIAAKIGEIRSQARAELDEALQKIIDEPLRLSSPAVYNRTTRWLADATQIQSGGVRLAHQIAQLNELLIFAKTPMPITFQSDNTTTVTLLKVGQLGEFNSKIMSLTPGKYIAEGIRPGYRDVRIDFIVDGEHSKNPVLVVCREAVL